VPKPDLIICLGGDPHKIYERKPETSIEEVTRQIDALNTFCMKKKNAVWVDTTQPIEKSVNDVMAAIVEMMSKRFVNTL
jgi:thymidylate kinase